MNKVLWNNEMDLCIGLSTEMDREDFIKEAKNTHEKLTGEKLLNNYSVSTLPQNSVWRMDVTMDLPARPKPWSWGIQTSEYVILDANRKVLMKIPIDNIDREQDLDEIIKCVNR